MHHPCFRVFPVCACVFIVLSAGRFPPPVLPFTTHIGTNHNLPRFASRCFLFSWIMSIDCVFEARLCGTRCCCVGSCFCGIFCVSASVRCKMEAGWRMRRMLLPWPPSASHNLLVHITWDSHTLQIIRNQPIE